MYIYICLHFDSNFKDVRWQQSPLYSQSLKYLIVLHVNIHVLYTLQECSLTIFPNVFYNVEYTQSSLLLWQTHLTWKGLKFISIVMVHAKLWKRTFLKILHWVHALCTFPWGSKRHYLEVMTSVYFMPFTKNVNIWKIQKVKHIVLVIVSVSVIHVIACQ